MNIIFLTLARITDIESRGIYQDLMRKFRDEGHNVYIVTPCERRFGMETSLTESKGVHILKVKTLNVQKTNIVEKGIGTLLIESQFKCTIQKYLGDVKFDLITYSTPPITFTNVVKYLKMRNPHALSYLQLKDIFPQNAVDLDMVKDSWPKVHGLVDSGKYLLYKYFRKKEKDLYESSDYIGCMSPANVQFVLDNNPEVEASRVEVAPNSIELNNNIVDPEQERSERVYIRKKYNLPINRPIFIYGGNLGKPQGIPFLIECLEKCKDSDDIYFLIVGDGTEYRLLEEYVNKGTQSNLKVMRKLPKEDYDAMVGACDVGMIFLDHRFTIPNFPSRLLTYMQAKIPVLAVTDPSTDVGKVITEGGFGWWCESNDANVVANMFKLILECDLQSRGEKGFRCLEDMYSSSENYRIILKSLQI